MAVSATLQRLTGVEREIKGLRSDVHALRGDLSAGLDALNERADRQTAHLAAIVDQLRHMNEGTIRALTEATRLDALEKRIAALEAKP